MRLETINQMKHSPIRNYGGIPGLTSWLISSPGAQGCVRLMECSRTHQEPITPHSHRFDFECLVLAGNVQNIIWEPASISSIGDDEYQSTVLRYSGAPGEYEKESATNGWWHIKKYTYQCGDAYRMKADEVHSIFFGRGASVLFFEGPKVSDSSIILEPVVDGEVVPTFKVEPWMFKRGGVQS